MAPTKEWTKFKWRKYFYASVLWGFGIFVITCSPQPVTYKKKTYCSLYLQRCNLILLYLSSLKEFTIIMNLYYFLLRKEQIIIWNVKGKICIVSNVTLLRANTQKYWAKHGHGQNLTNLYFEFIGRYLWVSKVLGFFFLKKRPSCRNVWENGFHTLSGQKMAE